ncbi:MAG TPA: NADH-quinone oxidoreductase subunit L [Candidatus Baltobacteraceae bacterium]
MAIWLFPLLGALACWFLGPQLKSKSGWLACAAMLLSFVATLLSWRAGTQSVGGVLGVVQPLGISWIPGFDFGLMLDPLSLIWALIITGVGSLIHLYSVGYMHGDRAIARFFAYMNFFVFAMLTLVLSDNFVGLLIGWGLVGLASYFLIGFWFDRPSAVAAARKAFVINVVGDVGIMLAIFILFANLHSLSFSAVFAGAGGLSTGTLLAVCVFLFVGAAAKSAQVPLHTWLPDAMEGPTPVSALIHAATMVTAGVYLIARCAPLWSHSPDAQLLVGSIGGLTALVGAILGTAQWDIKRILAYSTMSQIGYMIMGVGVGAYEGGVAHFFTHAFFKAQLFLGSGLIIHALANEQDVRRMGGLRKKLPFAFVAMGTGVLAICGIPGFSGFFSKDMVIYGTLEHGHPWMYAVGILTAGITAYYMFRLLFVTFLGEYRGDVDPARLGIPATQTAAATVSHEDVHDRAPAWIMAVPVGILIVPSVLVGWLMFGGDGSPWSRLFAGQFVAAPGVAPAISETLTSSIVLVVVLAGIAVAVWRYATKAALSASIERLAGESLHMPAVLSNAFYVDAAIDAVLVRGSQLLGAFFGRILDPRAIDGAARGVAGSAEIFGGVVRSLQNGLLRSYALALVVGVACVIAYYALAGGAH